MSKNPDFKKEYGRIAEIVGKDVLDHILHTIKGREIVWAPQPRQEFAMRCPATERFFGGAKGGGKTDWAIGDWLITYEEAYKRKIQAEGVFFRRTYPELDGVIKRTHEIFPKLGAQWRGGQTKTWFWPGGSFLQMRYLKDDKDVMSYQGRSYQWIAMDELGNYGTPFCYNHMNSCLRSPQGLRKRMLGTGNPGGPGQAWLNRRFVKGKDPNRVYEYEISVPLPGQGIFKATTTRAFLPSFVSDNKYWMENDPEYLAQLAALPEHIREAFLMGNWDVMIGQAFPEFGPQHVCRPFMIPREWRVFATLDWGFMKPYSLGVWAYNPAGRLYRIAEDYGCKPGLEDEGVQMDLVTAGKRFAEILLPMGVHEIYADPQMWERTGREESQAELVERGGCRLLPASKQREAQTAVFRSMLAGKLDDDMPQFIVFDTCTDWLRTVPTLTSDKHKVEDVDTTKEDHQWDDTRYAVNAPEVTMGHDFVNRHVHPATRRYYSSREVDYAR